MTLKLAIITGSTRPGRKGPIVADWVAKAAARTEFELRLVDLAELNLPLLDEPNHPALQKYEKPHTRRWSAIVAEADAFVFVTPEYDFFAPASLVNAIQTLSREWNYKAAGVVCYGGVSGGLRSAQALRQLLGNVGTFAIQQTVPLPFFNTFIGDDGVLTPNEQMTDGIGKMFAELAKWAGALKPLRAA